jgi:hypothetical protein
MNRRTLVATVSATCVALLSAVTILFAGGTAYAAETQQTFLTFYGWWDNTPPGGAIAYPQIHKTAGGKGTYADPITFATTSKALKPGTKVYVPRVKKYFIMEDSCTECSQDWDGRGPNGGPKLRHIDLWIGGKGGSPMAAIDCEDALTHYNADGTPVMEPVIANPSANETVDPVPIFNTGTGACYGGAKPNSILGEFKSKSTGQCMENPNNSTTAGTQLKMAACNGSAAQRFDFHGAWLTINNMCGAMSGGKVVLNKCNGGPSQQWSVNFGDSTISDIQSSTKCIRPSGANTVYGSCSGTAAKWTFPPVVPPRPNG